MGIPGIDLPEDSLAKFHHRSKSASLQRYKMKNGDAVHLRSLLAAARDAVSSLENRTRHSLEGDRELTLALVRSLEIVEEAAASVSRECRTALPQVPWVTIIGLRERLIHAYFDTLDILWKTATEDLPNLIEELERIEFP